MSTAIPAGVTTPAPLPNNFVGSASGDRLEVPPTPVAAPAIAPVPQQQPPAAAPSGASTATKPVDDPLAVRLERARRKAREDVLKELGVDNPDSVKAQLAELAKLKGDREKADREKLSREQQLIADIEKERKARTDLEAMLQEESIGRVYDKQDAMVLQIASRHVDDSDPDKIETARRKFSEYVTSISKTAAQRLTEKDVDRWFAKLAKDKPWLAKEAPVPAEPPKPPTPKARPISTAASATQKVGAPSPAASNNSDPSVNPQGKTFKPGQANSMSRAETAAELKRRGMRGWR